MDGVYRRIRATSVTYGKPGLVLLRGIATDGGIPEFYTAPTGSGAIPPSAAEPVAPEVPLAVPGFPSLPVIAGVTVPQVKHGHWKASTIAKDLCTQVGLELVWDTYDYDLREDVVVNGPILSAIQSLVEPFSHF